jgi:hypothetical protein
MLTGWPSAMLTVPAKLTYAMLPAPTGYQPLQLADIHVSLERVLAVRVVRLIDDDVLEDPRPVPGARAWW